MDIRSTIEVAIAIPWLAWVSLTLIQLQRDLAVIRYELSALQRADAHERRTA